MLQLSWQYSLCLDRVSSHILLISTSCCAGMPQQLRMTAMIQQMIPGGCGLVRSTQIQRQSPLGQTPLTWMKMRRKCSPRQERALPTPGQLSLLHCPTYIQLMEDPLPRDCWCV